MVASGDRCTRRPLYAPTARDARAHWSPAQAREHGGLVPFHAGIDLLRWWATTTLPFDRPVHAPRPGTPPKVMAGYRERLLKLARRRLRNLGLPFSM